MPFLPFVAVDQGGKPIDVPELVPESDEEKELHAGALRRRQLRLVLAQRIKAEEATELKNLFFDPTKKIGSLSSFQLPTILISSSHE